MFSSDIPKALDVARRIESGICHVNLADRPRRGADALRRRQESGWGRFGGSAALEEFTDLHWTMVMSQPGHYPIWREGRARD